MDKQQEYILQDASENDHEQFKNELKELLDKLSLNFSLVINKRPLSIRLENGSVDNGFIDQPSIFLQKKVIIPEVVKETGIPSTDPLVNPMLDTDSPTVDPIIGQPSDESSKKD